LPSEQLGLYAAAVAISGITNVLAQSVAVVMTPTIAQQTNEAARIEKVYEAFERYWTLNIFGTVAFAIMLPWVIPLLYGRDFVPAVLTAEVLLLASLSLNTRIVLIGAMQAFGEPQFASISEGLASILTVAILLLLIPSTGILGAAIASAAAYSASVSYLVFIFYRRHKVSPMKLLQPRPYLIWNLLSKYIPRNVTSPR
jgi:O-antigen/teichoic acid export membrane protein